MLFPDDVWRIIMDFIEGMVMKERQEWWKELHSRRKKEMILFRRVKKEMILFRRVRGALSYHRVLGCQDIKKLFGLNAFNLYHYSNHYSDDNYKNIISVIQEKKFTKRFNYIPLHLEADLEAENTEEDNQEFSDLFKNADTLSMTSWGTLVEQ